MMRTSDMTEKQVYDKTLALLRVDPECRRILVYEYAATIKKTPESYEWDYNTAGKDESFRRVVAQELTYYRKFIKPWVRK